LNSFSWYAGAAFEELNEELKKSATDADKTDASGILSLWVYEHQEPIVLGNLDHEPRFQDTIRCLRRVGLQSLCAIPLSDAHRRLGSLVIASVNRDAYSPEDVRFGALAATQIAVAIDDAINFREAQQARDRLQLLLDLNNHVVTKLKLRDLFREICANIRRVMECDGVAVILRSPEDQKLRLYALDFPEHPTEVQEAREPPAATQAFLREVFQKGEATILSREQLQAQPLWPNSPIESLAQVPLKGRKGVIGVLSLGTRREGAFAAEDLPFLDQIARQLAIAVENALEFGEVSHLKTNTPRRNCIWNTRSAAS
jgi:formate hydrogenlyase transcriptional activator